jgi:hypothetical protein
MLLFLGIILIILGLVVFALRGFLGVFPDSWEWVGIVLAAVGLLMGAPSMLQMAIGRPKLLLDFDRIARDRERHLAIFLKNQQLGNPLKWKKSIWRKLGIKRDTIESLTVSFRISEVGSGKILIPIMQARIYSNADPNELGTWRTTLPPTLSFETTVMVAMWDGNKKRAIVPGDKTKSSVELSAGIYEITVIIAVDGEPQKYSRQLIVGNTADDLTWVKPTLGKKRHQNQ